MLWLVWSTTFKKDLLKKSLNSCKNNLNLFKDCNSPCMVFAEVTNSVQGDPLIPLSKRPNYQKMIGKNLFIQLMK